MDYKTLYEKQYGQKELKSQKLNQFFGLRRIFKSFDLSRYNIAKSLIDRGERILDIGCGEGKLLRSIEDKFDELYGIDISPSRLKEAKEKSKSNKFKFIEANADEELPFENNFFDVVLCIATIEHIYNIFGLVSEIYRILKPNGYVVAEVPNIAYIKRRLQVLLGKLPVTSSPFNWQEIGWDGGHLHYFTMKKFCWLFGQAGFKVIKKIGSGFLAPFRNRWPSLLCGDLCIKAIK